jgi:hypothetical protein
VLSLSDVSIGPDGRTFTFSFSGASGLLPSSGVLGFTGLQWTSFYRNGQAPKSFTFLPGVVSGLQVIAVITPAVLASQDTTVGYADNIQVFYTPGNLTDEFGNPLAKLGPYSVYIPPQSTPQSPRNLNECINAQDFPQQSPVYWNRRFVNGEWIVS